jgi:hypothetical protein
VKARKKYPSGKISSESFSEPKKALIWFGGESKEKIPFNQGI